MADAGSRQGAFRRRGRGLTINQFAAVVIGLSLLMLATGVVLDLDPPEATAPGDVADSELEAAFAPAAGSDGGPGADRRDGGFSLREKLRERY